MESADALPVFRKIFSLDKPVARAVVHVCGLGHFELQLNGEKVGNDVLEPGWTNYRKTCLYVTHDVSALLRRGENELFIMLGNGMYNVPGGKRYKKFKGSFGPPKLILQLHVEFIDDTSTDIVSDPSWQCSAGPIRFSCIYGGEDYDARSEPRWQPVVVMEGPGGELVPQTAPPIRVMQTLRPVRMTEPQPGLRVYDLGQNFSGWPKITVQGPAGATVKLIPGELLDEAGLPSQKHTGSPVYFSYTLAGRGKEIWHPRFSYTGFRYIQVEAPSDVRVEVEGQFIHTAAPQVGQFACSNELLNRIHELILAAIRSNFQSVLTDCPHREKLGWLEQAHLMGPAIMYNFDLKQFYAKICRDMRDAQHPNGCVPTIAPQYTVFEPPWDMFNDSPEWGSAAVICPWLAYQRYGDRQILLENYEMMQRYVAYLQTRAQEGIIAYGLGDWYDIGEGPPGFGKLTTLGLTATAIFFQDLLVMRRVAQALGHGDDDARYAQQAEQIRQAFNTRFFNPVTSQYDCGSQTASAMPLALGIAEPQDRSAILENLINDIHRHDNHTTAGEIGFPYVLRALSDAGRSDVIYDLLMRTDPPSYGCQLARGATTLTEAWDANPRASQNHLMLGHAEAWFYDSLAGIRLDMSQPAEQRIIIRPAIVGDLTWARASYDSILGRIESHWQRIDERIELTVVIPADCVATVYLPTPSGDAKAQQVGPGRHVLQFSLPSSNLGMG